MPVPKLLDGLPCMQALQGPVWRVCTLLAPAAAVFLMVPMIRAQDACTDCREDEPDPEVFTESLHGLEGCVDCRTGEEEITHQEEGLYWRVLGTRPYGLQGPAPLLALRESGPPLELW